MDYLKMDNAYTICGKCLVKGTKYHGYVVGRGRYNYIACPICENTNLISKYNCSISEDELDGNLIFLAFMTGKDIDRLQGDIWD